MNSEDIKSDPWVDDILDRRHHAEMISTFLKIKTEERAKTQKRGYVLNLDSGWGFGKTFFLTRMQKQLQAEGHIAVYINGWLDDSSSEPMISVISEIENELNPYLRKSKSLQGAWKTARNATGEIAFAVAKGVMKRVTQKYLSDAVDEIIGIHENVNSVSALKDDASDPEGADKDTAEAIDKIIDKLVSDQIDSYRSKVKSMETFKSSVSSMMQKLSNDGRPLPMFVLVDELDRCRPTYSILMLEAIKHIFDIPNVAFIIATESNQLSKSIRAVYGAEFDSETYLRRFFDRTYRFDEPSYVQYATFLVNRSGVDKGRFYSPPYLTFEEVIAGAAKHFSLSIRDLDQCFDDVLTFSSMWKHSMRINTIYLLSIVMLQHKSRYKDLDLFVSGDAPTPQGTGQWTVKRSKRRHGERAREEITDIADLVSEFRNQSSQSLPEIANKDWPEGEYNQWIRSYFTEEFEIEHQNRSSQSGLPYSLLSRYPDYVRMLAHLR